RRGHGRRLVRDTSRRSRASPRSCRPGERPPLRDRAPTTTTPALPCGVGDPCPRRVRRHTQVRIAPSAVNVLVTSGRYARSAMASVMLGERRVAAGESTYVIAELSANHQGSLDRAVELVGIAAKAGADAVKLQTYTPDSLTIDSDREPFIIGPGTPWSG